MGGIRKSQFAKADKHIGAPPRLRCCHVGVIIMLGSCSAACVDTGVAWPTVDLSDSRYQQKGTYVWELTKELVEMHASQSRGNCLRKPSNGQVCTVPRV